MALRLKPVQPREGDIMEVISESPCTNMKIVMRDGAAWALKFFYANGAILYVPLPVAAAHDDELEVPATVGAMRS